MCGVVSSDHEFTIENGGLCSRNAKDSDSKKNF